MQRIAIIGFGFSGLMVAANTVKMAQPGTILYMIADNLDAKGLAYSTQNTRHLLNVPAGRMGAFPDAIEGFEAWLQTGAAALAKQQLGLTKSYTSSDFAPRALYAAYLNTVWQETQTCAAERHIHLKLVHTRATAIKNNEQLTVLTERGDAIAVDEIVLATGNEPKPILPQLPPQYMVQDPWQPNALADAASWPSPVMLMGTGLTAVDMVLALRDVGYMGQIIAFSRNGLLPQPHAPITSIFAFDKDQLLAQSSLRALLRYVRKAIAQHGEWRPVIDALRPYTQMLWQRFTLPEQQRFMRRIAPIWNVHRHRMAPEVAEVMEHEINAGSVRIIASRNMHASGNNEAPLSVTLNGEHFEPFRMINCAGPQQQVEKSSSTLLRQLAANGMIEPHATGIGLAADPQLRAWGRAHPHLYAIGGLLTGQLWESTAVPELRLQAAQLAKVLTAR